MLARVELIQQLIDECDAKSYLEIGVAQGNCFDKIKCNTKVGVDPNLGGTHKMTSNEFFLSNKDMFDVIFIDGMHEYSQVSMDFNNSIEVINEGGCIVLHDMIPRTEESGTYPRPKDCPKPWCGDVWKFALDLLNSDYDFTLLKIETGMGIVKFKKKYKSGTEADFNYFKGIVENEH